MTNPLKLESTGTRILTIIYVDIKKCGPLAAQSAGRAGGSTPASSILPSLHPSLALSIHLNLTLVARTP